MFEDPPAENGAMCGVPRYGDGGDKPLAGQLVPELPDGIVQSASIAEIPRAEILAMVCPLLAMWLYARDAISLGQAADWTRMDCGAFVKFIARYGVPVVNIGGQALAAELDLIDRMTRQA